MASASGCSIAGHFTLHQPVASRHVEKSVRRYSRLGVPAPERPPNPFNTHLRRAPRFRSAVQQSSARREYQRQEPWRSEKQIQRVSMIPNISSFGRRRDEASKHTFPSLSQTNQERQRGSRHVKITDPETSPRVCMSPPSTIFPARRPHRTRCSPKLAQDEQYEGHRSASVKSPSYVRADEEHRPEPMNRRSLEGPSYVPPSARRARPARSPPPSTNRWSFSSDSSTSSWSSSSSMVCPATPTSNGSDVPWSHSYNRDYAEEFEHAQHQAEYWGRQCFEIQAAWATQDPLLFELDNVKPLDLVFPDNHDRQESAIDSRPVYEEGDMGQTTVYTNHEVIARDARFAAPLQRVQDGALTVQPPSVQESRPLHEPKSRSADEIAERKKEELKQNKRTGAFPMWAEPAPREMQDKERDGIRFRFLCDSDESPSVSHARCVTGYEGQPTVTRRPNGGRLHSGGSDFCKTRLDGRTLAYSRH